MLDMKRYISKIYYQDYIGHVYMSPDELEYEILWDYTISVSSPFTDEALTPTVIMREELTRKQFYEVLATKIEKIDAIDDINFL